MLEVFQFPFMVRAFLAGIPMALVAGYFAPFIVQRGTSYLSNGLAHAAFGGLAAALLFELQYPIWFTLAFTVIVALLIVYFQANTQLAPDTVIGVLVSVSMALGLVLLSFKDTFTSDAFGYLFGDILLINQLDVWLAWGLMITLPASFPFWGRWAYASFDRDLAASDKLSLMKHDYLLASLLAIAIVVSVKLIGAVLVSAFFVIPAATARLVTSTFAQMTILSVIFSVITLIGGLLASYEFDWPSGPTVVLVQATLLICLFQFRR
jgi:zinc transport system permease protein